MSGLRMCRAGLRRSCGTRTASSAKKITTGTLVPKNALRETTTLATTPASLTGKEPVYRDGRETTAKNVRKSQFTIWTLFFVIKGYKQARVLL